MKSGKHLILLAIVVVILASGCLFKPPAEVRFSVDKTSVYPGGIFHIIVTVNNTGKVGLTGATLILGNENFQILQEPTFPSVLKVGQTVQLVWVIQAPSKPGIYNLQVSLELRDELKRTWTGFYGHFRITVTTESNVPTKIKLTPEAPRVIMGGRSFTLKLVVENDYDQPVKVERIDISLLQGMRIIRSPSLPQTIEPEGKLLLFYNVSAPYSYRKGFVSVILHYSIGTSLKSVVASFDVEVIWRPWEVGRKSLQRAYGDYYSLIQENTLVDRYWEEKFNSSSSFNRTFFRAFGVAIIGNASSEYDAALRLYRWVEASYNTTDNTTTVDPDRIFRRNSLSPVEKQLLITALLRSINVPARVVSLFNGSDCTMDPLTEFYTNDGWYLIDTKHGFIGRLDEYLASPYFPKVYQIVSTKGYRVVVQNPGGHPHSHVDVTTDFTSNLDSRIYNVLVERIHPHLRSKLDLVLSGMNGNERLYALFLLSSAPPDELNTLLSTRNADDIQKTIKALYEFYWDVPWKDDFRFYWRILAGG
ncbi:transglutaminase domain-containing protein [Thermococcus sp.]